MSTKEGITAGAEGPDGSGRRQFEERDAIKSSSQPSGFVLPLEPQQSSEPIPRKEIEKLSDAAYTNGLLKRGAFQICRILKIHTETAIDGISAEDIASSAIMAMLNGRRGWGGDLERTFFFVCGSIARHLVAPRKLRIGTFTNGNIDEEAVERLRLVPATIDAIVEAEMCAAAEALRATVEIRYAAAGELVFAAIADDLDLCELLSIRISAGTTVKPQQMAVIMGLPIKTVYELNRRLARRLVELRNELAILLAA